MRKGKRTLRPSQAFKSFWQNGERQMENRDITYPHENGEVTYTTGKGRASDEERRATP